MGKTSKTLTRLLATTCLTAASLAPAHASLVSEPPDFPGSFPGTTLPIGTDEVTGGSDLAFSFDSDFFTFVGLQAGQPFTITYDETEAQFSATRMQVLDSSNVPISGFLLTDGVVTDTIPIDGKLVVHVQGSEAGGSSYTVTLDAPLATPAPATLTLSAVGAALAGALGWRRRRTHGRPR